MKMIDSNGKYLRIIPVSRIDGKKCVLRINEKAYFLSDNYQLFFSLKKKYCPEYHLFSLERVFDQELAIRREGLIEMLAGINASINSFAWWGGQLASKSTSSVPLVRLIVYFFCALRILEESSGQAAFIVDSPALAQMINEAARKRAWQVRSFFKPEWLSRVSTGSYGFGIRVKQVAAFIFKCIYRRYHAERFKNRVKILNDERRKIFLRTWITEGDFDPNGKVVERNFGQLAEWLSGKSYIVYRCPMFSNLKRPLSRAYTLLFQAWSDKCLVPEHYLKFTDYFRIVANALYAVNLKKRKITLYGEEISPLFNEILATSGIDSDLCVLNRDGLMLKRLSEKGVDFERIIYPLECNAPENQFILSCRQYYPMAQVIGYQHTTFFSNQFAYHLAKDEWQSHPLPDKIVCSGKRYRELLESAGFPRRVLREGPNLRFNNVYDRRLRALPMVNPSQAVLVPLTYSYAMAADVFMKLSQAFNDANIITCVRTHPLLSKSVIRKLIDKSGLTNYKFADNGKLNDWLLNTNVMITTGASITTLEAIIAGVPVIRVVPDAVIHFDALHEPGYPLPCVYSAEEIRAQYERITELLNKDPVLFTRFGIEVEQKYFSRPTEELLNVFLEN